MTGKIAKFRVELIIKKSEAYEKSSSWIRIRYGKNKDCFDLKIGQSVFQFNRQNEIFVSVCNESDLNSHKEDLKCLYASIGGSLTSKDFIGEKITTSHHFDRFIPLTSLAEYFIYVRDNCTLSNSLQVALKSGAKAEIFENGIVHISQAGTIEAAIDSLSFISRCIDDHQYLIVGSLRPRRKGVDASNEFTPRRKGVDASNEFTGNYAAQTFIARLTVSFHLWRV